MMIMDKSLSKNFTLFKYFMDNKKQFNPEFIDVNRKFKWYVTYLE